jgi:hypothetical protein
MTGSGEGEKMGPKTGNLDFRPETATPAGLFHRKALDSEVST